MDSKHKNGTIAELKAALYYEEHGWSVFWPTSSQTPCDFIAVNGKTVLRIQVKSGYEFKRPSGRGYIQSTIRKGSGGNKRYSNEDCDLIVVVYEDAIWVIPVEDTRNYTTINLQNLQEVRKSYKPRWD